MNTRFIKVIGYRVSNRDSDGCQHKKDFQGEGHQDIGMNYACDVCGSDFYANMGSPIYNTESGRPEPGDIFWADYYPENMFWENHKGPHLVVVLPNKDHWNIDSRASNCTMPDDRQHRCWCRHGNPETEPVHVDKNGNTCSAGGGSIIMGDYHGFLHHGQLVKA